LRERKDPYFKGASRASNGRGGFSSTMRGPISTGTREKKKPLRVLKKAK